MGWKLGFESRGRGVDPRFVALYRAHFGWVRNVVGRLGLAADHRDDVVQEIWLAVHRRLDSLETDASPRGWLYAIARRVAARDRRTEQRGQRRLAAMREVDADLGDPVGDRVEARDVLREVLDGLPEQQRRALLLNCRDGLTGPELAQALGVPLNTAYSRLRLARRHVQAARRRRESEAAARCWAIIVPKLAANSLPITASLTSVLFTKPAATVVFGLVLGAVVVGRPAPTRADPPVAEARPQRRPAAPPTTRRAVPPMKQPLVAAAPARAELEQPAPPPTRRRRSQTHESGGPRGQQASTLEAESELLRASLDALRRGQPKLALAVARDHRARFEFGKLAGGRDVVIVRALCQLDRVAEARRVAARQSSAAVQRALVACSLTDSPVTGHWEP